MTELHGIGDQGEFMLCGLAFDAFESGDHHEPVKQAKKGQTITCPDCRRVLDVLRTSYGPRGYKYIDREDSHG
jgi:hypothetical protein